MATMEVDSSTVNAVASTSGTSGLPRRTGSSASSTIAAEMTDAHQSESVFDPALLEMETSSDRTGASAAKVDTATSSSNSSSRTGRRSASNATSNGVNNSSNIQSSNALPTAQQTPLTPTSAAKSKGKAPASAARGKANKSPAKERKAAAAGSPAASGRTNMEKAENSSASVRAADGPQPRRASSVAAPKHPSSDYGESGGAVDRSSASMQAGPSASGSAITRVPSGGNVPTVFQAVYSNVPVHEMMVRGIGVMRRRSDSWINATQILKVAGINKGQRTKILDKDIAATNKYPFEKIQGGYGRYQGTWMPFHCAAEVAEQYGVLGLIQPLLDYKPASVTGPLSGVSQMASTHSAPSSVQSNTTQLPPLPPSAAADNDLNSMRPPANRTNGIANSSSAPSSAKKRKDLSATDMSVDELPFTGNTRKRARAPAASPTKASASVSSTSGPVKRQRKTSQTGRELATVSQQSEADVSTDALRNRSTSVDRVSTAQTSPGEESLAIVPQHMRRATHQSANAAIIVEHRLALMQLFIPSDPNLDQGDIDPVSVVENFPPDLDVNTPIDDQMHTALHWAAALARTSTVESLVRLGADVHRGNLSGETPLMRAVLVTNNADSETFAPPGLLSSLCSSLRTTDDADRTVLHHIALVAGIKGRSASARQYMESILHFLLERESSPGGNTPISALTDLLDAQDANGDTALNIAARVGSRAIVKMLVESGANSRTPNKFSLRPGDFGNFGDILPPLTAEELAVEQLNNGSSTLKLQTSRSPVIGIDGTERKIATSGALTTEIMRSLDALLEQLNANFVAESQARSQSLQRAQEQLQHATAALSAQRQIVTTLRDQAKEVELVRWRIRNLSRALQEEDSFDWTGRSDSDGQPAFPTDGVSLQEDRLVNAAAFEWRGPAATLGALPAVNMPVGIEADPSVASAISSDDGTTAPKPSQVTLAQLRRMVLWYERVLDLLQERTDGIQGGVGGEAELDARRVVKLCIGLDNDEQVDELLDKLIVALESDGRGASSGLDLQRISNFMAKVKTQDVA